MIVGDEDDLQMLLCCCVVGFKKAGCAVVFDGGEKLVQQDGAVRVGMVRIGERR